MAYPFLDGLKMQVHFVPMSSGTEIDVLHRTALPPDLVEPRRYLAGLLVRQTFK